MRWLFWKEYRQNRVVIIALLAMLIVPHLFGLYAMGYEWHESSWQQVLQDWRQVLAGAGLYSLGLSQAALALIGGNAIAGERADRSAEFQAYLPLTRQKILAAKLLLALAIAAAIWLINPLIVWSNLTSANRLIDDAPSFMINAATTGLAFFCVAWFFSTILRSPTFSVAAGLAAPIIILSLIAFGIYLIRGDHPKPGEVEWMLKTGYVCISLAVALASFGVGTWLYLRRVEP